MDRQIRKEMLDDAELDEQELMRSLREVWQVNRYMGGNPALFAHIKRMVLLAACGGRQVNVLDVATGLADQPLMLIRWAERKGIGLTVTGVDINSRIVRLAAARTAGSGAIRIEQGDGRRLTYPDGSFDIAFSNLALHHFDGDDAAMLLRELERVSRIGWVAADLERHPAALGAARLLARFVWRSPITRHDGPLSVQRAYTAAEAEALARRAGVDARLHRHFPFRLALVGGGR